MRKGNTKREERRGIECTDATLAIALIDAEHRNVSSEVTFAMWRLLTNYDSDGMGNTLSICLCREEIVRGMGGIVQQRKDSYEEGKVRPTQQ